jgi:Flp pilus assembly pilin Flp
MNNFKSILFTLLATLVKDESGQDLVEYGLSRLAGNLATELSTIGSTLTAST